MVALLLFALMVAMGLVLLGVDFLIRRRDKARFLRRMERIERRR